MKHKKVDKDEPKMNINLSTYREDCGGYVPKVRASDLPPLHDCFIDQCAQQFTSLRNLKSHILMDHPDITTCSACIDQKVGVSSTSYCYLQLNIFLQLFFLSPNRERLVRLIRICASGTGYMYSRLHHQQILIICRILEFKKIIVEFMQLWRNSKKFKRIFLMFIVKICHFHGFLSLAVTFAQTLAKNSWVQ